MSSSKSKKVVSDQNVKTLGVIGAGVMGQALIRGMLAKGLFKPGNVWAAVKTEASLKRLEENLSHDGEKIEICNDYLPKAADTDIILLCVKPNGLKGVLEKLRTAGLKAGAMVISIVAGQSIETMENILMPAGDLADRQISVIRAMTNTPCTVGQGMTAVCGGTYTTKHQMTMVREMFEAVGECLELDETHFDAVTGLSGSGPAYVYLIMEALVDGGVMVGLPRQAALKIVSQTLLGAATMVQQSKRHPASLRDDVTTPAGCTIGALLVMEDGKIRSVLARAVEEAARIAAGLG